MRSLNKTYDGKVKVGDLVKYTEPIEGETWYFVVKSIQEYYTTETDVHVGGIFTTTPEYAKIAEKNPFDVPNGELFLGDDRSITTTNYRPNCFEVIDFDLGVSSWKEKVNV